MSSPIVLQAIVTKYLGPTNVRGSRVKATAAGGTITIGWDNRYNSEVNHALACAALVQKMGWQGQWHQGGLPSGDYCFVCQYAGKPRVVIEVSGGVAEVTQCPDGIEAEIIDHDNLEAEKEESQ